MVSAMLQRVRGPGSGTGRAARNVERSATVHVTPRCFLHMWIDGGAEQAGLCSVSARDLAREE